MIHIQFLLNHAHDKTCKLIAYFFLNVTEIPENSLYKLKFEIAIFIAYPSCNCLVILPIAIEEIREAAVALVVRYAGLFFCFSVHNRSVIGHQHNV